MLLSSLVHAPPLSFFSGSSPRLFPHALPCLPPPPLLESPSSATSMISGILKTTTKHFNFSSWIWFCLLAGSALAFHIGNFPHIVGGDFGEENVELVRSVANLEFSKAVILGNHDAWHTKKFSGKKKDGIQLQLEWHGDGSAKRICKAALSAPEDHIVIILAHNGPTGLGSNSDDICGKDWEIGGGDYGDADLAQAPSLLKKSGKVSVSLVVFGHMHKQLAGGKGLRKMIVVGADNTVYLNAAIVPRVKRVKDEQGTSSKSVAHNETSVLTPESCGTIRAFTLVDILDGRVDKIVETWVSVVGDRTKLEEGHILFKCAG